MEEINNILHIACISPDYRSGLVFIKNRYSDKIKEYNAMKSRFILTNGDIIYNCFPGEMELGWKSFEFDAYIVHPQYESLEDIIKLRVSRGRP